MNKMNLLTKRILAYIIDCLVVYSLFALTQLTIFSTYRSALGDSWFHNGYNTEIYTLITVSIPALIYFAFFDSLTRGTIGKRLLKIRVRDNASGTLPSIFKTLLRTVCKLLPWEIAHLANNLPVPLYYANELELRPGLLISLILLVVYLVVVVKTKGKQTLYDKLLNTSTTVNSN